MTLIFGGFIFDKWWRDRFLYATIFKRIMDIILIKIRQLKGKNNCEISGVNYTHDSELFGCEKVCHKVRSLMKIYAFEIQFIQRGNENARIYTGLITSNQNN